MANCALDLIKRSLRLLGVLASGESPNAEQANDALSVLNQMMDIWSNDRLTIYATQNELFPVTIGVSSYTIGPGATWNTTRPLYTQNSSAFIRVPTSQTAIPIDYPMRYYPNDQFQQIIQKSITTTYPYVWTNDHQMPISTIRIYPVPTLSSLLMSISSTVQLTKFCNVTDYIELPPGYEMCMSYNLAVHLGPEYGVALDPVVNSKAIETLALIKRTNTEVVPIGADPALLTHENYSIYAG
jgi:hypothetical protein